MSTKGSLKVLLDTNFLLLPAIKRINLLVELDRVLGRKYELLVPSPCMEELHKLKAIGGKLEKAANLALKLIERHARILDVPRHDSETVDDLIVRIAKEIHAVVATCDKELRKRLRAEGIPVVFYRAYKKLELNGEV